MLNQLFKKSKLLVLVFLVLWLFADDIPASDFSDKDLSVKLIKPELRDNADAVIRFDYRTFEYRRPGQGRLTVHKAITILNQAGLDHARISLHYDSFREINRISGAVYDSLGNRIERIRGRHFDDRSFISGFSLVEDSRVKSYRAFNDTFPYTIEIEYRVDFNGFIQLPNWIPIARERTSLELAHYDVILPEEEDLQYRMFNLSDKNIEIVQSGNDKRYIWSLTNHPAIEREFMGPPWYELHPAVSMSTGRFSMDRKDGSMENWSDFALWFHELWNGRDQLPDHVKSQVDEIVQANTDTITIVRDLYSMLQGSTRYVSIQLGIGGFQTETAEATARNSYGDCKALTNYLLAMLRYAGIKAYPALIRSGSRTFPFDSDFVHDPFNHVIVYVPLQEEGIWIEATSNTLPAGYPGSSNAGRHTLLFHEDGGELKKTPVLTSEMNFQHRDGAVYLNSAGDANLKVKTRYGSWQHERIRNITRMLEGAQQSELRNMIPYNNFKIQEYEVIADNYEPEAFVRLDVNINSLAESAGNRLILYPNILERYTSTLSSNPDRKQPLYIQMAYRDTDEITFHLPDNIRVEAIPVDAELEFEYGKYRVSYHLDESENSILFRRELTIKPGILPPGDYDKYRFFINSIVNYDANRIVLLRN